MPPITYPDKLRYVRRLKPPTKTAAPRKTRPARAPRRRTGY